MRRKKIRRRLKVNANNQHTEEIQDLLKAKKDRVDEALNRHLSLEAGHPETLIESMKYSLFSGGKRLRPILVLAAGEAVGGSEEPLLPFACAMEMIHTYSLIHDDLPSMDDDDYRRGRLTNHKVYGEAVAILAGDALLTLAFKLMTGPGMNDDLKPEPAIRAIREIADAAGLGGMVGGQVVDILSEGAAPDKETVNSIHEKKTGALIRACTTVGGLLSGGSEEEIEALKSYGGKIGLAFQIIDDILDIEGEKEALGKDTGKDQEKNKTTYPAVYGLDESKEKALILIKQGIASLEMFGEKASFLRDIAAFILMRKS